MIDFENWKKKIFFSDILDQKKKYRYVFPLFFFKFSKSINCIVAQNGVKRQKHLDFRFKTDFAPLPWASKSIKIIKKWMKMIDMIEIRFALYYFSHFLARKKY